MAKNNYVSDVYCMSSSKSKPALGRVYSAPSGRTLRSAVPAKRSSARRGGAIPGEPDRLLAEPSGVWADVANGSAYSQTVQGFPKRIIFVRHGESDANVMPDLYAYMPNQLIGLSKKGINQAVITGQEIKGGGGGENVHFYYSPYNRTVQTMLGIAKGLGVTFEASSTMVTSEEDYRLREMDNGNFQDYESGPTKEAAIRKLYSWYYYRWPEGESGPDVNNRADAFLDRLLDDIKKGRVQTDSTVIVVSHAVTIRFIIKAMFNLTVEQYLCWEEPDNAGTFILTQRDDIPIDTAKITRLSEAYTFRGDNVKSLYDLFITIEPKMRELRKGLPFYTDKLKGKPIYYFNNYEWFKLHSNSSFTTHPLYTDLLKYHSNLTEPYVEKMITDTNQYALNDYTFTDKDVAKTVKPVVEKNPKLELRQLINNDRTKLETDFATTRHLAVMRKVAPDFATSATEKSGFTYISLPTDLPVPTINNPTDRYKWVEDKDRKLTYFDSIPAKYPITSHPAVANEDFNDRLNTAAQAGGRRRVPSKVSNKKK